METVSPELPEARWLRGPRSPGGVTGPQREFVVFVFKSRDINPALSVLDRRATPLRLHSGPCRHLEIALFICKSLIFSTIRYASRWIAILPTTILHLTVDWSILVQKLTKQISTTPDQGAKNVS